MTRHSFDVFAFTAGLVFLGLGVLFAVAGSDVLDHADWLWPVLLIALGGAGLAANLRREPDRES